MPRVVDDSEHGEEHAHLRRLEIACIQLRIRGDVGISQRLQEDVCLAARRAQENHDVAPVQRTIAVFLRNERTALHQRAHALRDERCLQSEALEFFFFLADLRCLRISIHRCRNLRGYCLRFLGRRRIAVDDMEFRRTRKTILCICRIKRRKVQGCIIIV